MIRLSPWESDFSMACPKCTTKQSCGLVKMKITYTSEGAIKEIYCINCGWRPKTFATMNNNRRRKRKWTFKKPHELKAA